MLVLDDDVTVAELMRVVLDDAGSEVSVAHDANDLPSGPFDCVVTDLMTLDLYSFEGARDWLLRLGDRFPATPIVAVTAHPEALDDARRLGVRVVLKPFDVDALVAAVRAETG